MERIPYKVDNFHENMEAYSEKNVFNSSQLQGLIPMMFSNLNSSSSAINNLKRAYPNYFNNAESTTTNKNLKKYRWTNDSLNFMLDSIIKNRDSDQPFNDLYKAKLWKDVTKEMNDVGYAVKIRNCTRKFRNLKVCNT